jgi:hypothetical protein
VEIYMIKVFYIAFSICIAFIICIALNIRGLDDQWTMAHGYDTDALITLCVDTEVTAGGGIDAPAREGRYCCCWLITIVDRRLSLSKGTNG